MWSVTQHFRCEACDNDEPVTMTEARAAAYEAAVTCGGCGRPMKMVAEDREADDGTEGGIPYGPMGFLGL